VDAHRSDSGGSGDITQDQEQYGLGRTEEHRREHPVKAARAGAVAVVTVGVAALLLEGRRLRSAAQAGPPSSSSGWHAVTVFRPREEIWPDGRVPTPLAALGSSVEIDLRPAPGGKGTEVRARLRTPGGAVAGKDAVRWLRRALRESKQVVEVGEVLRVDPVPHGERKRTPTGAAVEFATDRGPEEGSL